MEKPTSRKSLELFNNYLLTLVADEEEKGQWLEEQVTLLTKLCEANDTRLAEMEEEVGDIREAIQNAKTDLIKKRSKA